jgi:predicted nucleic acid-binding Zn finger protein
MLTDREVQMLSEPVLSQSTIEHLRNRYGKRFVRALRAVEEGKVVKYHFTPSDSCTWIVQGHQREYLTIPDVYCSCRSFYQSVVISREVDVCYHMLAQKIADLRNAYRTLNSTDSERRRLYVTWRRTD